MLGRVQSKKAQIERKDSQSESKLQGEGEAELQQNSEPCEKAKVTDKGDKQMQKYIEILPYYLVCPLCEKLIVRSSTTICQHVFCQVCLLEYFVYLNDCPVCGRMIREETCSKNLIIDNMVTQLIKQISISTKDISIEEEYNERKGRFNSYIAQMKLKSIHQGEKVDACDSQGVWRTGKIMKLTNSSEANEPQTLTIKFDGITRKITMKANCNRIAKLGFYTSRDNIPEAVKGKKFLKDPQDQEAVYTFPLEDKF